MQKYTTENKPDLRDRCFKLSLGIIHLTDTLPNKRACWIIADQLIRSITSIGANLTEAKASSSRLEYKKFYEIALKSAHESMYWLNLLKSANFGNNQQLDIYLKETDEIVRMLATGVINLKRKNF